MRTKARENLITVKEKSKMSNDRKINPLEKKIVDNVFLLKGGKIKMLDNQYKGTHEVLDVLGKGNVNLYMNAPLNFFNELSMSKR